jgi:putative NIF3 family GTP cyclohydrolase 1 type 2
MKILEIIDKLKAYHPPVTDPETSDTVKYGNPDKECTGIAVTCFASADVIRKTAELGANLIICHEPTFYSHPDKTEWLKDNKVYQAKTKLLDETGIVIWRDHDCIHGSPYKCVGEHTDMIYFGIMKALGWEPYMLNYPNKPLLYKLPETTVHELSRELIAKLHLNGMRVIGDTDARVSTVFICEHVFGDESDNGVIKQVEEENIDVIIPLELIEWNVSEYVRDSAQLGIPKAILNIGHFNFEEAGMKYMAEWLPGVIGGNIPVHYVQSGDGFRYIV